MSAKILERDPVEEMRKAFRLFDEDDKGKIDLKNLRRVARELGESLSDDQLQAMIDEFDLDRDGQSRRPPCLSLKFGGADKGGVARRLQSRRTSFWRL